MVVVGDRNCGVSSDIWVLLNMAVRNKWRPIYVELDVGKSDFSINGVISAFEIDRPIYY